MDKTAAKAEITRLVDSYLKQFSYFQSSKYKEAQLRIDFINPFLAALGWDVENYQNLPPHLREVVQEPAVDVEEEDELLRKNPDYALRTAGRRKCFIEVKKPSVDILKNKQPAFQLRRYGWNAELKCSILINFTNLVFYDCGIPPTPGDEPFKARIKSFNYQEYLTNFDELFNFLSKQGMNEGSLDSLCKDLSKVEHLPFDEYFLKQIEKWRFSLGQAIIKAQSKLKDNELNYVVQKILNRIMFLRICEDRTQEIYEQLKRIGSYTDLKELFHKAEKRYNSGLFDFVEDKLTDTIELESTFLLDVFKDLYYPDSPYNFSVLDSSILSRIYEIFLGQKLRVSNKRVQIIEKPDVVETNGIVPTPDYIVYEIVDRILKPLLEGKTPEQISKMRFADICCGSGTFLITLFDYLINWHINYYFQHGMDDHFYIATDKERHLSLSEKRRILANNVFGVDIDPSAVEVSSFNLYIKLLENETADSIESFILTQKSKVLPNLFNNIKCGNSLIDGGFFKFRKKSLLNSDEFEFVNPLDWKIDFDNIFANGGFDAIIGNPPYIRIQNMVKYSPNEVAYYQSTGTPYTTAHKDNFDKYYLFIERALSLLNEKGRLGYITPHKFTIVKAGENLRKLIATNRYLNQLIHFGTCQVFEGRSTYTCIIILDKLECADFFFEKVDNIAKWQIDFQSTQTKLPIASITEQPWLLVNPSFNSLVQGLQSVRTRILSEIADIYVGLQTSADTIYIIKPFKESARYAYFEKNGKEWQIEKAILRPCIYDLSFIPFSKPSCNAYMIFPYQINNNGAVLIPESLFRKKYPYCWKYLFFHKVKLSKRNIQGGMKNKWYQFGRSQSLTKFTGDPKLVWPVLSLGANYTYDNEDVLFTGGGNGPYYALRIKKGIKLSLHYLLAVLSNPLLESSVKQRASTFRGGYYSHGKEYVSNLPILIPNLKDAKERALYKEIILNTKKLISLQTSLSNKRTPHKSNLIGKQFDILKNELADKLNKLYNTPDDEVS
jgi:methylase of polypeptide subunit release factors